MNAHENAVKTGTSTVGITFKGGVVVGADHRATMGHFIANKSVQKLFKIGDNLALTTAGLVGHAQSLSRTLAAEVQLFELKRQTQMTVKGAATLTANILAARALNASGQRDAASGNGMDLAVITVKDGYVAVEQTEISKILSKK